LLTLFDADGPTPALVELEAALARIDNLILLAIDNAALVYAANENDRVLVTRFLRAARSALKLFPENHEGPASLKLIKANHAKPGLEIPLEWRDSVLVRAGTMDEVALRIRRQKLDRTILKTVAAAWDDDNPFSARPQTAGRYLPRHLASVGEFKTDEVATAVRVMLDNRVLVIDQRTTRTPKGLRRAVKRLASAARAGGDAKGC
jgi:hypothetical protein